MKSLSTDKAVFSFTDEILLVLNNKMHIHEISSDPSKALDCENHATSLSKLWYLFMEFEIFSIMPP
jgi:hypothetical protein